PTGTQVFTFYDSCRTDNFSLLMIEYMGTTPEFVWQTGLTYVENGKIPIADNFQLFDSTTTTLANIPANISLGVREYTMIDGLKLNMDEKSFNPATSGTQVVALRYPPGAGSGTFLALLEAQGLSLLQVHAVATKSSPANLSVDLAQLPLPVPGSP